MIYDKYVKSTLSKHNKVLNKLGYSIVVNDYHVKERLRERQFDVVDFVINLRKLCNHAICQMIYGINLDRPYRSFYAKFDNMVIVVGTNESDNMTTFKIRTVLDTNQHSYVNDSSLEIYCGWEA